VLLIVQSVGAVLSMVCFMASVALHLSMIG
jgi:hypothetical protein